MLRVVRCMVSVICCPSHDACLPLGAHALEAGMLACARARARADASIGTAVVADKAVGRAQSLRRPRAHTPLVTATAAPRPWLQSGAGLQLAKLAVDGTGSEKALLADLTEKNPDASYVELLRLFKVRRSVADGSS